MQAGLFLSKLTFRTRLKVYIFNFIDLNNKTKKIHPIAREETIDKP